MPGLAAESTRTLDDHALDVEARKAEIAQAEREAREAEQKRRRE